jgi:hypothetical protein
MEALSNVMSLIDQNSESIPEGDYLKLCNLMKVLHTAIPKSQPSVPFSARPQIPLSLREDSVRDQRAYAFAEERVLRINQQLKRLKIRQRITVGVKEDAVHDCCRRLGFNITDYNVEALREKGVLIPDERAFYKSYLDKETWFMTQKRTELLRELPALEERRDEARATMLETFRAIDAYRALRV